MTVPAGDWAALVGSVPVEPGAEEARRWAEDELSRAEYRQGASLVDWLAQAVSDLISRIFGGSDGGTLAPLGYLLALLALAATLVVAWLIARPLLASRRRESAVVLEHDGRTASELDDAARAAAVESRWHDACLDAFRALVRGAEERTVIDPREGRTAHEASVDIASALPGTRSALTDAARRFDALCYSDAVATSADYAAIRAAADAVARTRLQGQVAA
ncbi:DUF4129 domain-containing protein [Demequina salsinemoris]|uniref:DUF4129 domain-containing protein n=1 Tax=Demequina salsinemoris TaxID=577470 RepID=UPI0007835F0D|nr:DUF4129 domain-containing protein [Demequina salsinemoris]